MDRDTAIGVAGHAQPVAARLEPTTSEIRARAEEAPDAPAVESDGTSRTYAELWARSEAVARAVSARASRGARVVVAGRRCFGLVAALVGVLDAGRTIVPIDPALPDERRRVLVELAEPELLIGVDGANPGDVAPALAVDRDGTISAGGGEQAYAPATLEDDAYVFFTSGTTGEPKAVLGTQAGLAHFLTWQRETFAVGPGDRIGQLTGLSFDVVLRDIFLALVGGATLCIPPRLSLDGSTVVPWLAQDDVTALHAVPALARSWLRDVGFEWRLPKLRVVFFAGEPLSDVLVGAWRRQLGFTGTVVNLYGPTETTLAKCWHVVADRPPAGTQPLGRELPDAEVLVVARDGSLCPPGRPGELVIRTPFATRGYLNPGPDDASRFRAAPSASGDDGLAFWTGDVGLRRPDGVLEFRGRLDDQVKIRGVRVGARDVEARISRLPSVAEAAVVVEHADEPRLAAFVVPRDGGRPPTRRDLAPYLPSAAVPESIVEVARIPLTANGKADRTALLELLASARTEPADGPAPAGGLEQQVAEMWEDVLEQEGIARDDDFFDLGGESMAAMRLATRLESALGYPCAPEDIFKYPTVAELVATLRGRQPADRRARPPSAA
jgi:amino acid adenylation domain-containing protein